MANLDLYRSRDADDMPPQTPSQRASKRARYHQAKDSAVLEANGGASTGISIAQELADAKRMVQAFDAIDSSMTEAREKLKIFYKTADETNTLLDMWIRLLSQTEHTLNLLQDPDWEGKTKEEIQAQEAMEKRSAIEEAIRRETMSSRALQQSHAIASLGAHGDRSSSLFRQGHVGASATVGSSSSSNTVDRRAAATANAGSLRRSQLASSLSKKPSASGSSAAAILAAANVYSSTSTSQDNRRRQESALPSIANNARTGGGTGDGGGGRGGGGVSATNIRTTYPHSSSHSR
ncbi:hypothetical protein BGW42_006835 [Actinomortierella wolfii]|nr:hypothetical protein BGW42_006835 [Actinomortierella wolfii]